MPGFDPAAYGPTIASLLGDGRAMPLDGGRPDGTLRARLTGLDLDQLLAPGRVRDRESAEACLAALWLWGDDLDRSHRISQGLHGQDGCYWHGIMHRREGDFSNAKYWMRRVGEHPIHDALNRAARELAAEASGDTGSSDHRPPGTPLPSSTCARRPAPAGMTLPISAGRSSSANGSCCSTLAITVPSADAGVNRSRN